MSKLRERLPALRANVARACRSGDPRLEEAARRDLAAAKLEDFVARVIAEAPPLTPEQRDRIARLLRTGVAPR